MRHRVEVGPLGRETSAGSAFRNLGIIGMRERFEILRTSLNRGCLDISLSVGMMRFNKADVFEEKFVAARRAQLTAFEEDADFWRRPVLIVGQDLDDDRDFVRGVTFKNDKLQLKFFVANTRAFFDCAFDGVAGDALLARFLDDRGETGVPRRISAAHFCGDHDFLHEFADDLAFLETRHFAFGVKPLTTHALT